MRAPDSSTRKASRPRAAKQARLESERKNIHPLVVEAEKALGDVVLDQYGLASPRDGRWSGVHVAAANIPRALKIIASIVETVESAGFAITLEPKYSGSPAVVIDSREIEFKVSEHVVRSENPAGADAYPRYVYRPGGKLRLKIPYATGYGVQTKWNDNTRSQIEDQVDAFLESVVHIARARQLYLETSERERQEEAEERCVQAEQETLRFDREQQVKQLVSEAFRWREVQILREYLAAVRAAAAEGGAQDREQLQAWLRLAEDQVQRLDPLSHRIRGTTHEDLGGSTE